MAFAYHHFFWLAKADVVELSTVFASAILTVIFNKSGENLGSSTIRVLGFLDVDVT